MDIVRNDDGTLVVPVQPERSHVTDDDADASSSEADPQATQPTTRVLHPEKVATTRRSLNGTSSRTRIVPPAVSTASGRQEAMGLVHAVANSPDHAVAPAVAALADPNASGEALRHVLVGGVPSVEAFAAEIADAKGGDPYPLTRQPRSSAEVLNELDS